LYIFVFFRVPSEDPSGQRIILQAPDFDRIRRAAIVVNKEEREAMELQRKLEKEEADVCSLISRG
jgi:hypothetical protein